REPLDRRREQGRRTAVGVSCGVDAPERGSAQSAFCKSDDIGQDATESARQLDLRATREAYDGNRAGSQVDTQRKPAKGAQTVVAVGYRIQEQVGQGPDRQSAPDRACPRGAGGTDEYVGCGDHGWRR